MDMYRQGDVLIIRCEINDEPAGHQLPLEGGRVILAHGEATGHAHAIPGEDAALYAANDGAAYRHLRVLRPTALRHEEHGPISLRPGLYRVIRQREYSPEEIRYVLD